MDMAFVAYKTIVGRRMLIEHDLLWVMNEKNATTMNCTRDFMNEVSLLEIGFYLGFSGEKIDFLARSHLSFCNVTKTFDLLFVGNPIIIN